MDDKNIVQLYWDRNEQAISVTADKYGHYCTSIARNILFDEEDAKECVNDTYFNAWTSMPPQRPRSLTAFLGRITRNLSLNRYKYKVADKRGGGQAVLVFEEIAQLVSDKDSVEQEIIKKELIETLDSFLEKLPADKRCIFVRRYWYFDSISDIAKQFDMTENNVSVTLNRLRMKLHKYLLERGFEL